MNSALLKRLGFVTMSAGFLWGAFLLVQHPGKVVWLPYGVAFAITAVGAILLRVAAAQSGGEEGKVASDMTTIRTSLEVIVAKVGQMNADKDSADTFSFSQRIDDELMDPINDFVEAREAMIHKRGLQDYAAMMDGFALGERAINRTWCASADGYIDEVHACLERAEVHFRRALEIVEAAGDGAAAKTGKAAETGGEGAVADD